jgi:hypothetical protein
VTPSSPVPADDLTLALTATIRAALDGFPQLALDPDQLAVRLAPVLSARLSDAARTAGTDIPALARGLAALPAFPAPDRSSVSARILAALRRHPSGREPGVTPESLVSLTGLPGGTLGTAVSTLVQAGELVRDAWLVRLPQPDDLLLGTRPEGRDDGSQTRQVSERRAIGDRRALGERRLYDRRALD